jgi:hypothetical protein
MAENKKGFILYADWISTFEELEDDEAGRLIKHIFRYVNDLDPESADKVVRLVFSQIKQQLKRDLEKYENKRKQWSDAGQKSAESRRLKKVERNPTVVESVATDSTVIVNVTDNVIVTDKVKVIKDNNKDVAKMPLVYYQPCLDFWLKEFHPDWTFGGVQGKALKSLIKKIEKLRKNENDSIVELFKIICWKLPDWYKDKDLPIIDSKFNEIIEQIKTQNNGKSANKHNELSKGQHTINAINELIRDVGTE